MIAVCSEILATPTRRRDGEPKVTKAIIYLKSDDLDPHASRCAEYLERQGYELEGVIMDDWDAAQAMLDSHQVAVIVASTTEHLPPKRRPRIEIVANERAGMWEARTRIIRRNAAR
jgi:hypothetical protein